MDHTLHAQFAAIEWTHWWFRARRRIVEALLEQRLAASSGRRILDVGCGAGAMIDVLERFGVVSGMDLSAASIDYCSARFPQSTFWVGGVPDALPSRGTADVICAFDVIEHIDDDEAALRSLRDVLVPDGVLVITVPAYEWLWGPHDDLNQHKRRYTRSSLRDVLGRSGFTIERTSYFNTVLFPIVASTRLVRRHILRREEPASDFVVPRPFVNAALTTVMSAERWPIRRFALPVGVSLVAIAHKPALTP